MASAFNSKLAVYGQWTYRVAWALEIVAASIGLATGLALGYQAYTASLGTDVSISTLDLALASAPFLMVALAELIKIPVATLLFSVKWVWKPVLAICLALMALITFETVFFGLERASAQRQIKYEDIRVRKETKTVELQNVEQAINNNAGTQYVGKVQEELDQLNAIAASELKRKEEELQRIQTQIDDIRLRNPQFASLERQIRTRGGELDQIIQRRDNEVQQRGGAFERQRDSYDRRIAEARAAGDMIAVRRYEEERARLRNPVPEITERYSADVQRLETELRTLRSQQFALETNESESDKQARQSLEQRRATVEQERIALEQQWQERRNLTLSRLEDAQNQQRRTAEEAAVLRSMASKLRNELAEIDKERVAVARVDQVRRFAGRIYRKQPEQVEVDEAEFIALVWFGSLAGLAAFAGPLTAIVALGLQRSAEIREQRHTRSLSSYLRRWLIQWRFRRTKSVPLRVEVPVDREIEKRIEVPVEKVIKEILYVPVLTDDPDAVRKSLSKDLPAEIADLVRVKFKGEANANPA
ncbi:hypothetical protein [Microvirga vignae]|nr:hypothetical protein [Microvirga vignae]